MARNANEQLVDFFRSASSETVWALIEIMDTFWQTTVYNIKQEFPSLDKIPKAESAIRAEMAVTLANHVRWAGSNDIAFVARAMCSEESGADYMAIVRDVLTLLNKQLKKKANIPRVASLSDYEQIICEQILQIHFQNKTEEEIASMLSDSGLSKDAAAHAAKELAKVGISGASLVALVKIIGKKAVQEIIKSVVIWIIARFVGKDAAEKIILAILKKVPQKLLARLVAGVGWAILAWDVTFGLAGPAKRVTVPCVALISADRCMRRMKDYDNK